MLWHNRIQNGEINLSFVIAHRLSLEQAPHGYEIFKHNCIKIVIKPQGSAKNKFTIVAGRRLQDFPEVISVET